MGILILPLWSTLTEVGREGVERSTCRGGEELRCGQGQHA